MPINDDAASDHQLPLFLAEDFDAIKQQGPSRVFKLAVLVMAAAVIAGALVIWGEPATRLAGVTETLVGASAQVPDTGQATPPAPSSDQAQAAQPADGASSVPPAAVSASADARQAGTAGNSDALFRQFQAWAQQQNSQPDSPPQETAQQSPPVTQESPQAVQDAAAEPVVSAPPVDNAPAAPPSAAPAPVRAAAAPKPRQPVRELRNARAEMEAARRAQAKVAHAPPTRSLQADDGRGQDAPPQASQSPSLLQIFGLHN